MEMEQDRNYESMDTNDVETIGEIVYKLPADSLLSARGDMFRGHIRNSPKPYVVKKIKVMSQDAEEFRREFEAASKIKEDLNVLKLEKYEQKDFTFFLAFSSVDYSLDNLIFGNLPPEISSSVNILNILKTTTRGLLNLHNNSPVVLHRNIHIENIFIHKGEGKIANFTFSKQSQNGMNVSTSRDFSGNDFSSPQLLKIIKENKKILKNAIGTPQLKKLTNGTKADIFSLGIVYFYALTGKHLFERDGSEIETNILNKNFDFKFDKKNLTEKLNFWQDPLAKQLIIAMVQYNQENRPSAKQILNHPLFWTFEKQWDFFTTTHDFIHGTTPEIKKEKELMNIKLDYSQWQDPKILPTEVEKAVNKRKKLPDNLSGLLKALRHHQAHIKENDNEEFRNYMKKYKGKGLELFLKLYPSLLSDVFNYFIKFSSKDTLREFYCDCYCDDGHKCDHNQDFYIYDWNNFKLDKFPLKI